jgi:hypothetical protein
MGLFVFWPLGSLNARFASKRLSIPVSTPWNLFFQALEKSVGSLAAAIGCV